MGHARPATRGRLIIVSGLPGSGKTRLAERLEHDLQAIRLAPDEWMADLGVDLYDAERVNGSSNSNGGSPNA